MPIAQSAHIQEYDYEPSVGTLDIQFVNGAVYRWTGITPAEYDNFHQSGSKGAYVHSKLGRGTLIVPALETHGTRGRLRGGRR